VAAPQLWSQEAGQKIKGLATKLCFGSLRHIGFRVLQIVFSFSPPLRSLYRYSITEVLILAAELLAPLH